MAWKCVGESAAASAPAALEIHKQRKNKAFGW